MSTLAPFLTVNFSCDEALTHLSTPLSQNGLRILRTFDLHDARLALHDCGCPHHGTDQCDCQMVVLLIYGKPVEPATLILHGSNGQTWFSLTDDALHPVDPTIQRSIEQAFRSNPPE